MKIGKIFHDAAKEIDRGVDSVRKSASNIDVNIDINKDIVQRFDSVVNMYDRFLKGSSLMPDLPTEFPTDVDPILEKLLQDRRVQAYINVAEGGIKAAGKAVTEAWKAVRPYAEEVNIPFGGTEGILDGASQVWSEAMDAKNLTLPQLVSEWGKGTTLWEDEWHALRLCEMNDQVSGKWGSAFGTGYVDVMSAQARVFALAGLDTENWVLSAGAGVQGKFEVIGAHYQFGYDTPSVNLYDHPINLNIRVAVDAFVGVTATIEAAIKLGSENELRIGGDFFAGASASIQGAARLGDYVGIHGEATAWAGIGAKAELAVVLTNGELTFDCGVGAAFGLGAEYDFGFEVNFLKTGELLYDIAPPLAGDISEFSASLFHDLNDAAGDVSNQWKEGIKDVSDSVSDSVKKAGKKLSKKLGF